MDGTENKKPEVKILILPTVLLHLLLGAGIVFIGQRLNNKKEIYAGILFILSYMGAQIYAFTLPCYNLLGLQVGAGCDLQSILGLLSIGSWIYVIARIYQNKEKTRWW